MPSTENNICKLCKESSDIGGFIPKIDYIVFDFGDTELSCKDIKIFNLGEFGKVYLVPHKEISRFKDFDEILKLNDTEFDKNNGFKFVGNTVPLVDKNNKEFFKNLEEDEEKISNIEEGQVVEFKYLANLSKGDKKFGIFRADVDNLGLIFSDGLKGKYTISRIATLSRMLDTFFTGYVNKIVEEVSKEFLPINVNGKELKYINSLIYIVYSGGDDIFIIAPYDVAIKFAQEIREKFYNFTCGNMDFGISGGIFISSPTMPIHLSAKYSEKLENKSKKTYYCKLDEIYMKDSISIFNKTYRWKEFIGKNSLENLIQKRVKEHPEENFLSDVGLTEKEDLLYFEKVVRLVNEIVEIYEKKSISRGFLYKLFELYNSYVENGKYIKAHIYPKIYYQIARNIKDENVRDFFENLLIKEGYENMSNKDIIKNLDVIISLVLMKTRGGS